MIGKNIYKESRLSWAAGVTQAVCIGLLLFLLLCIIPSISAFCASDGDSQVTQDSGNCNPDPNATYENQTWYTYKDKTLTISGSGAMPDYDYDGKRPWSGYDIETIIVEDGVTKIGDMAFSSARIAYNGRTYSTDPIPDQVTKIDLASSVQRIGHDAFAFQTHLEEITLPDGLQAIERYAFVGCSSLEKIIFNEHLTSIGEGAFYQTGLKSLVLPDTIVSYGKMAFSECESLVSLSFAEHTSISKDQRVESFSEYCFSNCKSLTNVSLPSCLHSVGDKVFYNSTSLKKMTLPDELVYIGNRTFESCVSLKTITIPKDIEWFGYGCFRNCINLESISLPQSMTWIGGACFANCTSLTKAIIPPNVINLETSIFMGCSSLSELTLHSGIRFLRDECLKDCTSLKGEFEIPANVEELDTSCFEGCSGITKLSIPGKVKSIPKNAFTNCSNLEELDLPSDLIAYGERAFANCTSLPADVFRIPASVNYVGDACFAGCSKLISFTWPSHLNSIPSEMFSNCSNLKKVILPDQVTEIKKDAFSGCSSLEEIRLPSGLKYIGWGAFSGCAVLELDSLPSGLETIESYAFDGAASIKTIKIPDKVIVISNGVFRGCTNLEEVQLGKSLKSIDTQAFSGTSKFNSLIMPTSITRFEKLNHNTGIENLYFTGDFPECFKSKTNLSRTGPIESSADQILNIYYPSGNQSWNVVREDEFYKTSIYQYVNWIPYEVDKTDDGSGDEGSISVDENSKVPVKTEIIYESSENNSDSDDTDTIKYILGRPQNDLSLKILLQYGDFGMHLISEQTPTKADYVNAGAKIRVDKLRIRVVDNEGNLCPDVTLSYGDQTSERAELIINENIEMNADEKKTWSLNIFGKNDPAIEDIEKNYRISVDLHFTGEENDVFVSRNPEDYYKRYTGLTLLNLDRARAEHPISEFVNPVVDISFTDALQSVHSMKLAYTADGYVQTSIPMTGKVMLRYSRNKYWTMEQMKNEKVSYSLSGIRLQITDGFTMSGAGEYREEKGIKGWYLQKAITIDDDHSETFYFNVSPGDYVPQTSAIGTQIYDNRIVITGRPVRESFSENYVISSGISYGKNAIITILNQAIKEQMQEEEEEEEEIRRARQALKVNHCVNMTSLPNLLFLDSRTQESVEKIMNLWIAQIIATADLKNSESAGKRFEKWVNNKVLNKIWSYAGADTSLSDSTKDIKAQTKIEIVTGDYTAVLDLSLDLASFSPDPSTIGASWGSLTCKVGGVSDSVIGVDPECTAPVVYANTDSICNYIKDIAYDNLNVLYPDEQSIEIDKIIDIYWNNTVYKFLREEYIISSKKCYKLITFHGRKAGDLVNTITGYDKKDYYIYDKNGNMIAKFVDDLPTVYDDNISIYSEDGKVKIVYSGNYTVRTVGSVPGADLTLTYYDENGYATREFTYSNIEDDVRITPPDRDDYTTSMYDLTDSNGRSVSPDSDSATDNVWKDSDRGQEGTNPDEEILMEGQSGPSSTFVLYKNGILQIEGSGSIQYLRELKEGDEYPVDPTLIKKIVIGEGITEIRPSIIPTFQGSGITELILPDSIKSIGEFAFNDCRQLKKVVIGKGLEEFNNSTFNRCDNLTAFVVDPDNPYLRSDRYGVVYNHDKTQLLAYPAGAARSQFTIPASVKKIQTAAFRGSSELAQVTIPENLESIGICAFENSGLSSLIIPAGNIYQIGNYAFSGCGNLEDIFFEDYPEIMGIDSDGTGFEYTNPIFENVEANVYYLDTDADKWDNRIGKDYGGTLTWILRKDLSEAVCSMPDEDLYYEGKAVEPEPLLTIEGETLKKGRDYTVSYSNNKKVGTGSLIIKGTGSWYGSIRRTFPILKKQVTIRTVLTKNVLLVGETAQIISQSDETIRYSAEDSSIIKVSSSGKITALNEGTTNLLVTSPSGYRKTYEIRVTKKSEDDEDDPSEGTTSSEENEETTESETSTESSSGEKKTDETEVTSESIKKAPPLSDVNKNILSITGNGDPAGSSFHVLRAGAKKITKKAITLRWTKVRDASGYVIYGNQCGKRKKYIQLAVIMNNKTSAKKITSIGRKKLKKGTYYKFVVVATAADRSSGGKAVTKALATSVSIHCMTLGARGKGDYKKVLLKSKSKVLLNKGKKSKILAKQKAAKGIRVSQHRKISYVSTDPGIATVSKKGIITARKKGRAIIYVYSQNGLFKTVKVTVR